MAKKAKPLTDSEWDEVFRLRCRSKRGEYLSPDHQALLERAYKSDPKRYGELDRPVFEATKPYGAG
jgi:hypothetical protein